MDRENERQWSFSANRHPNRPWVLDERERERMLRYALTVTGSALAMPISGLTLLS